MDKDIDKQLDDIIDNIGKNLKNYVVIMLDRSGSMSAIRQEAIDAFNEQIKAVKESTGDMITKVSLVTFGSATDDPIIWNQKVKDLKPMTSEDYIPYGMTALMDTFGYIIDRLHKEPDINDPNTSFLIIAITDGGENNSKKYSAKGISSKIKELQNSNRWTFTYLGANQNMFDVSKMLNIPIHNTQSFDYTPDGMTGGSVKTYDSTVNYMNDRLMGYTSSKGFYNKDERIPQQSKTIT